MKFIASLLLFLILAYLVCAAQPKRSNDTGKRDKSVARQLDYLTLISTLLQQSNLLSSIDGVLLAVTTILASLINKLKPFFITTGLWYMFYVALVLLFPTQMRKLGLPTLQNSSPQFSARSVDGATPFESTMAETFAKGIKITPVMNVVTNVTVTVISETMSRLRTLSRAMINQVILLQGNMVWFGRVLSAGCVSRFMCRVGQFTNANFPTAATMLRSLADTYPEMDDYAVAVVRGTSSSNCSLIYPDCTL